MRPANSKPDLACAARQPRLGRRRPSLALLSSLKPLPPVRAASCGGAPRWHGTSFQLLQLLLVYLFTVLRGGSEVAETPAALASEPRQAPVRRCAPPPPATGPAAGPQRQRLRRLRVGGGGGLLLSWSIAGTGGDAGGGGRGGRVRVRGGMGGGGGGDGAA